jgi:zinc transporter 9
MLVVEQLSSSHAHAHPHPHPHKRATRPGHRHLHAGVASPDSVFDVELEDGPDGASGHYDHELRVAAASGASAAKTSVEGDSPPSAYPITIGLVLHGLADGLALGMSMLSNNDSSSSSYALTLVVFLALAVHKGTYATSVLFSHSLIFITAAVLLQPLPPLRTPSL